MHPTLAGRLLVQGPAYTVHFIAALLVLSHEPRTNRQWQLNTQTCASFYIMSREGKRKLEQQPPAAHRLLTADDLGLLKGTPMMLIFI